MQSRSYMIPHTVILQNVDDETLLFDSATELFFALNEVGAILWKSMQKHDDLQAVFAEMAEAFDVESERLGDDLNAFADTLAAQGLIVFDTP